MKVMLFAFGFLCVVQASLADTTLRRIARNAVNAQKESVNDVITDLSDFQLATHEKLEMDMSVKKAKYMMNVEEIVSYTLGEIRNEVADAKSEEADQCYQVAKTEANKVSQSGNKELDLCVKHALDIVKEPFVNIVKTIELARATTVELDSVIPNCESSIDIKMYNCVMMRLSPIKKTVRNVQSDAKAVKKETRKFAYSTNKEATSCMDTVLTNVRIGTTEVRVNTGNCIRSS